MPTPLQEQIAPIRRTELFGGLPDLILAGIAWLAEPVEFAAGEVILWKGSVSDDLLVIVEGIAAITTASPWEPGVRVLDWCMPGESVGELAALLGSTRSATVTAATPMRALRISSEAFRDLVNTQPLVAVQLSHRLAQRVAIGARRASIRSRGARLLAVIADDGCARSLASSLRERVEAEDKSSVATLSLEDWELEGQGSQDCPAAVAISERIEGALAQNDLVIVTMTPSQGDDWAQPVLERVELALVAASDPGAISRWARQRSPGSALAIVETSPEPSEHADAVQQTLDRLGKPHSVSCFIPTTIDVNVDIDPKPYVERAVELLGRTFGGATVLEARGVWQSEELGLVGERIMMVRSYCSDRSLKLCLGAVTDFVMTLKAELRQEAMALDIDGRLVLL